MVGDQPDASEVACNRIVRLAFKIYPVRRAVKRLFSSGVCDIGRFVLHECDVALLIVAGR